ncbi:VOC family protein [Desulfovibrio sulfodismutans]|uniref:VOC family protein n=1 Tax=Desulfolutivibrio sulfodismutans TaxID=63561 RepID=A0A7K3NRI9_9BACT|nr:VOC family protein [Desulfolutivibrio sulfodismutans]NDY57819.1 VOC family protein [Desulfolutivibrio sulfodismutans]QLA11937.1 VOC family protein [Desulfolutivibrio sulfodismutans DSM 3696]
MPVRYAHTNIIAKDWRRLASFYEQVLGCTPVPPERDLSGAWLDALTGLSGSRLRGMHLRLPGHGESGPTLEIFSYDDMPQGPVMAPNTPGLAHLAFAVDDVAAVTQAFLSHGGSLVGESIDRDIPGVGRLFCVYARDPEGNMVELQRWEAAA